MIALLFAALLQSTPTGEGLEIEGVNLGRLSTAVALCAEYGYRTDEIAARRFVDDFEGRAAEAGWTSSRIRATYAQGQNVERDAFGVVMDPGRLPRTEVRRAYLTMLGNTKRRCRFFAETYSGAVSGLAEGDRTVDAAIRQMRRGS